MSASSAPSSPLRDHYQMTEQEEALSSLMPINRSVRRWTTIQRNDLTGRTECADMDLQRTIRDRRGSALLLRFDRGLIKSAMQIGCVVDNDSLNCLRRQNQQCRCVQLNNLSSSGSGWVNARNVCRLIPVVMPVVFTVMILFSRTPLKVTCIDVARELTSRSSSRFAIIADRSYRKCFALNRHCFTEGLDKQSDAGSKEGTMKCILPRSLILILLLPPTHTPVTGTRPATSSWRPPSRNSLPTRRCTWMRFSPRIPIFRSWTMNAPAAQ
jgi:hypothetical protein